MKISIILPILNEEENLKILFEKLNQVLKKINYEYEIIAINDGSKDNSFEVLKKFTEDNQAFKIINFSRNFGQTAALSAGINHSSGDILIPMDSDLENDPEDIIRLLNKIKEGYDVVSGWRKERWKGKFLTRKLPSVVANWLISAITKVKLHDYGCTMKAYKREILEEVKLYGEMHRFIPVLAFWQGAKIGEISVNYQKRKYGKTNYGLSRTYKVVLDLLTIKFLTKYSLKPMHFFGGIGILSFIIGSICFLVALYLRFLEFATLIETPLPLAAVFLWIISIQLVLMGLIAEMIMRNYFETQGKPTYKIKQKINF